MGDESLSSLSGSMRRICEGFNVLRDPSSREALILDIRSCTTRPLRFKSEPLMICIKLPCGIESTVVG